MRCYPYTIEHRTQVSINIVANDRILHIVYGPYHAKRLSQVSGIAVEFLSESTMVRYLSLQNVGVVENADNGLGHTTTSTHGDRHRDSPLALRHRVHFLQGLYVRKRTS